jgi:hypothetical protein
MKKIQKCLVVLLIALLFPLNSLASEKISISKTPIDLKSSRLEKNFDAYEVTIKNNTSNPLQIKKLSLDGTVSSQYAVERSTQTSGQSLRNLWAVCLSFWVFVVPIVYATIATPIILVSNSSKNKSVKKESKTFYKNLNDYKEIPANGSIVLNVLSSKNHDFDVNVITN